MAVAADNRFDPTTVVVVVAPKNFVVVWAVARYFVARSLVVAVAEPLTALVVAVAVDESSCLTALVVAVVVAESSCLS